MVAFWVVRARLVSISAIVTNTSFFRRCISELYPYCFSEMHIWKCSGCKLMSFSRIFSGKIFANNDDRMRLDREIQHVSVWREMAKLQNEQARARRGTVPTLLDGETSTSRSRLSQGSSSQGHISLAHVDQEEAPAAHDDIPHTCRPLSNRDLWHLLSDILYRSCCWTCMGQRCIFVKGYYLYVLNKFHATNMFFNRSANVWSLLTTIERFWSFIIMRLIGSKVSSDTPSFPACVAPDIRPLVMACRGILLRDDIKKHHLSTSLLAR